MSSLYKQQVSVQIISATIYKMCSLNKERNYDQVLCAKFYYSFHF